MSFITGTFVMEVPDDISELEGILNDLQKQGVNVIKWKVQE